MLHPERLRVLHAVARHGSVRAAAEALHVTTSAVSQQMAKLERETGQAMLARHGRGVRLTDAGALLAGHAEHLLSQLERAEAELEAHRGQVVGTLVIGAFPTAARGLLPDALAALRRDHPRLRTALSESEPEESVHRLDRGEVDLAVVLDWHNRRLPAPPGLATAPLLDDVADVAVPDGHPLADAPRVTLTDFADDDWVSWPEGEFCHDWLLSTLRAEGVEPRLTHRAKEHHTQLALVAAGLGVAVAPRLGRGPVPPGVRIVPVAHTMRRHVYAAWRRDAGRRPSIRAAVEALRKAAAVPAAEPLSPA